MSNEMRRLNRVPYGTPQHTKLVKKLQSTLTYNEYVLCMKGKYAQDRVFEADNDTNFKNALSGTRAAILPNTLDTVYSDSRFYFVNRTEAEYNLEHRQVNVGLLIVDKLGRVLITRKNNGHAAIVGGHTDYNKDSYTVSVSDLMYYNLCKEFREEVICHGDIELPKTPSYFVTEGESIWDFFHCWYIYLVEVDNLDDYSFESNEKKKHITEITPIDELIDDKFTKSSLNGALRHYMSDARLGLVVKTVSQ